MNENDKQAEPVANPDCWRCGGDGCAWCKDAVNEKAEPVAVDHSGLIKRIDAAIERVTKGWGLMSIPADPRSDVDLVLSECKALLQGENPPFWATDFHPAQPVQPGGAQGEPDLLDLKLPIAVRVGGGIFGKGVSLRTVANKLKLIQDTYDNDLKARMSQQSIYRENETESPAAAINEQLLEALKLAKVEVSRYQSASWDYYRIDVINKIEAAIRAAEAEKARGRG